MRSLGPSIAELERRAQAGRDRAARRRVDEDLERRARRSSLAAAILVGVLLAIAVILAT